jgi:hypothetical protein
MLKTIGYHYIIDQSLKYLLNTYITEFSVRKCIYLYGDEINQSHIGMRLVNVDLRNCYPIPITYIKKLKKILDFSKYVVCEFDDAKSYRPPNANKVVYLENSKLPNFSPLRRIALRSDVIYGISH